MQLVGVLHLGPLDEDVIAFMSSASHGNILLEHWKRKIDRKSRNCIHVLWRYFSPYKIDLKNIEKIASPTIDQQSFTKIQ